ncbi:hypothetical protein [Agrobacterium sp. DSM 25558]|uniref:hypothetical protein n=1 Tax=Agrobacterium sp. DSM 25558 TaxID=1907665 RepID=UPI00190E9C9E|nr:hypothetical protein [Agrobacterium sp. DSM 25558]
MRRPALQFPWHPRTNKVGRRRGDRGSDGQPIRMSLRWFFCMAAQLNDKLKESSYGSNFFMFVAERREKPYFPAINTGESCMGEIQELAGYASSAWIQASIQLYIKGSLISRHAKAAR